MTDTISSQTAQPRSEKRVEFHGKSGEFFKIWIVNLLFSILTLGIYSAWAKVRTAKYFHGNTELDGHRFRYLAQPIQILKGRIVAVAIFIVFSLVSSLNPVLSILLTLAFLLAFPWLLVQGLKFSLRMTSYRNVRFGFHAKYGETFLTFIIFPLLGALSLYLAFPWVLKKIDQFMHNNVSYGDKPLSVSTSTGQYYLAVLAAIGSVIILVIAFAIVVALLGLGGSALQGATNPGMTAYGIVGVVIIGLVYWLGLTLVTAVYQSMIRNHLFASMMLEDVAEFRSEVRVIPYAWIQFSNAFLILITLGLAYPIAKIRKTRYLAGTTYVTPLPGADQVLDQLGESSVFGEETAEVFDVDFALG